MNGQNLPILHPDGPALVLSRGRCQEDTLRKTPKLLFYHFAPHGVVHVGLVGVRSSAIVDGPQPHTVSEDCLTLRITRPAGTDATQNAHKLPVMVFVYGGGSTVETIYDSSYDPVGLIRRAVELGTPMVYVAMNYRLNLFGFADLPALRASNSTNVGLRDQRLALDWVRRNVALFGGDPDNVTLFGEDAGAVFASLHMLTSSDDESLPVHRVIAQSGAVTSLAGVTGDTSACNSLDVAKKMHTSMRSLLSRIKKSACYAGQKGNVHAYANFAGHEVGAAYLFVDNLHWLQDLKRKYDLHNIFCKWHNLMSHTERQY